jgi:hypothetical protein
MGSAPSDSVDASNRAADGNDCHLAGPSGVSRYQLVGLYESQICPKAKKSHAKTAITISMIKATSELPKMH